MLQDQSYQMTNSHKNREQVNEQEVNEEELQDITGGCRGCGALAVAATMDGNLTLANGRMTGSRKDIVKGISQIAIGVDSASSVSRQIRPCKNCVANTLLYAVTKAV